MKIVEALTLAKEKNERGIIAILNFFKPLIHKYGNKIGEDGQSEIILFIIELVNRMPVLQYDGKIVNYINVAIRNYYYKEITKKNIKEVALEYYTTFDRYETNEYNDIEILSIIELLSSKQKMVIISIYYYGISESDLARQLNITRQCVNNTKKRALKKLEQLLNK